MTGFEVVLEGVRAVVAGFDLPVGVVVELEVVRFLKGNLAVDVDLAGGVHTGELVLTVAENDLVEARGFYVKVVFHPLAGGLPLLGADGVQLDLRGVLRFRDRGFTVINRIHGKVGRSRRRLCDDVDLFGRGRFGLAGDVFRVGRQILVREEGDRLDHDVFADRHERDGVGALLEEELEGIGEVAVRVNERVLLPGVLHRGNRTELVAVGVDIEASVGIGVHPDLLHDEVADFREREHAVDVEAPFNRVCLLGDGAVVDFDGVRTGGRDIDFPGDLAVIVDHEGLAALALIIRYDGNFRGGLGGEIIDRLDFHGSRSSRRVRVFFAVIGVRVRIQALADFLQCRLPRRFGFGHFLRCENGGGKCRRKHQKRQYEARQSFACGFSHRTFLLQICGRRPADRRVVPCPIRGDMLS